MVNPSLKVWLKGMVCAAVLAMALTTGPVRAQDAGGSSPAAAAETAAPTSDHEGSAATAEGEEGEHAKKGLPQLDTSTYSSQLFWLVISFGTLFILMSKVALPRVGAVLDARTAKISGDLDRAGQAKSETETIVTAYEKALSEARTTASKAMADSKAEADAAAARQLADLAATLSRRQAAAEAEIAAAKQAALSNVTTVAAEVAAIAVAKLAGVGPSDEAVAGAIAGALKERA